MLILAVSTPPDMTIQDVAAYLGVTPKTVRQMIVDGRIRAYKLGDRIIRLRRSEIDAALEPIAAD
jgi:excisionase family DNA binding protein